MARTDSIGPEEAELIASIDAIMSSTSPKKLVVGGPGAGKTTLFRRVLESLPQTAGKPVVLTFINNLRNDLEKRLGDLANVYTLHSFCLGLLRHEETLRASLSSTFECCPGLSSLVAKDWELIEGRDAPKFVSELRNLVEENHVGFYLDRGNYYDAVDFDDCVFRALKGLREDASSVEGFGSVLVDEYQDFNALEAEIINILGAHNRIMIVGDDDQALYGKLRSASWDHIRLLWRAGEYEVFELPFCMRCTKVVVDAVNDVISKARDQGKLEGRIEKLFKHFPPAKAADSERYPLIDSVETSVQNLRANYMGRYIAKAVAAIPRDEIEDAVHNACHAALVIAEEPYRGQIVRHLRCKGFRVETRSESDPRLDRDIGLSILKDRQDSNLGWRIVLNADSPSFLRRVIRLTADRTSALSSLVPEEYRARVLEDVDAYQPQAELPPCNEETQTVEVPCIKVTTFEGAKGLSAQHVFIAGLHDGELPRNSEAVKDLEICKFIVGLTRTRKKCTLIHTRRFAGELKSPSAFLSWIAHRRLNSFRVNQAYWN